MYGVVLWRAPQGRKAVIWCEDHGELALYEGDAATPSFEADDAVSFDLDQGRRMRVAFNLKVIEPQRSPVLGAALGKMAKMGAQKATPPSPGPVALRA